MSEATEALIMAKLAQMHAEQKALMAIIAPLVTRKDSRKDQAKRAGCSTRTITRREKAAQRKLRISGIL